MIKHQAFLLLLIGGLLMVCTGCISPNSHDNLTTTPINANSKAMTAICPTSGNTSSWIQVDPIAFNHTAGEPLVITGTTNIKTGERLHVSILPPYRFGMVRTNVKQYCDRWEGETTEIQQGNCSVNTWSFSDSNLTRTLSPSCPGYTVIVFVPNSTITGGEDEIRIVDNTVW